FGNRECGRLLGRLRNDLAAGGLRRLRKVRSNDTADRGLKSNRLASIRVDGDERVLPALRDLSGGCEQAGDDRCGNDSSAMIVDVSEESGVALRIGARHSVEIQLAAVRPDQPVPKDLDARLTDGD